MSELAKACDAVKPGLYRHYKNKEYRVIGSAKHSETLEDLVLYQPLYGERGYWVRPVKMFQETVKVDGRELLRFERIGD